MLTIPTSSRSLSSGSSVLLPTHSGPEKSSFPLEKVVRSQVRAQHCKANTTSVAACLASGTRRAMIPALVGLGSPASVVFLSPAHRASYTCMLHACKPVLCVPHQSLPQAQAVSFGPGVQQLTLPWLGLHKPLRSSQGTAIQMIL